MGTLWHGLSTLVGGDAKGTEISTLQATARAFLMYIFAVFSTRIGKSRLLGRTSAVDVVVTLILSSIWGRAINGSGTLSATTLSTFVLLALHWAFVYLTCHNDKLGRVLKGQAVPLIENGQVIPRNLDRTSVSHKDLEEALRVMANLTDPKDVAAAYLERNGDIGVVKRKPPPEILDIHVEAGVQIVRVKLE